MKTIISNDDENEGEDEGEGKREGEVDGEAKGAKQKEKEKRWSWREEEAKNRARPAKTVRTLAPYATGANNSEHAVTQTVPQR